MVANRSGRNFAYQNSKKRHLLLNTRQAKRVSRRMSPMLL
nr:MAG TPA: hypothetical protein [Caudoviricetes sp.]